MTVRDRQTSLHLFSQNTLEFLSLLLTLVRELSIGYVGMIIRQHGQK